MRVPFFSSAAGSDVAAWVCDAERPMVAHIVADLDEIQAEEAERQARRAVAPQDLRALGIPLITGRCDPVRVMAEVGL